MMHACHAFRVCQILSLSRETPQTTTAITIPFVVAVVVVALGLLVGMLVCCSVVGGYC
jgi:hypothetical protein